MDRLPKDPMILFSTVNMLLRDDYRSLDDLCDDMNVDRNALDPKERPAMPSARRSFSIFGPRPQEMAGETIFKYRKRYNK